MSTGLRPVTRITPLKPHASIAAFLPLLAEIDALGMDANVRSVQAQLELSEADVAWTKHNAARAQKLLENKVTSQQDYNAAKANEQVSQATRDHDAALLQLERDMQGFEEIQAPFSGTITARYLDVGALVAVGSATDVQKQDSREAVKLGRDYGTKTEILKGSDLHDWLVKTRRTI